MQQLVHRDSVKIGLSGSIYVMCYDATPTLATAKVLEEALVKRFDAAPDAHWALLSVIDATMPPPDQVARAEMARVMKGRGTRVSAVGHVVIGSGFQAGAVRAALVGMTLLARSEYPMKVFPKPGLAVDWLGSVAPNVLKALEVQRTKAEIEQFVGKA